MAISPDLCKEHIASQKVALANSAYPYRKNWPSRLFRHEPLESAIKIIRSMQLKSRRDADAEIAVDIAPADIIGLNSEALGEARLYFRPRTPTQWNIEGIREPVDFYKGKHAPVLYMFLLKANRVLSLPGVRFSNGNMQSGQSQTFDDDAGFKSLDFSEIYHEGPILGDRDLIRRRRCAEVLCPSPLDLNENLEAIICRSDAERQLLLHELGPSFLFGQRIRVFKEPGIFNADFSFVESADLSTDGLHVQFHPPNRGAKEGRVVVNIESLSSKKLSKWDHVLDLSKNWKFKTILPDDRYGIEIYIRNCLAYRSTAVLDSNPF